VLDRVKEGDPSEVWTWPGRRLFTAACSIRGQALERNEIGQNRHGALDSCLRMIFSENRCTLFRIMR
jgi:hypothetical protein